MDEVMKMMTPGNSAKGGQNQGMEMFEDYSLQTGFTAMANEIVPLLDGFCFHNAANCPDCESGMVKQGGCFSCPACGFSACS